VFAASAAKDNFFKLLAGHYGAVKGLSFSDGRGRRCEAGHGDTVSDFKRRRNRQLVGQTTVSARVRLAAEEVAHQSAAGGRRALAIEADVSREEEVQAMFANAVGHFGTLHIAVNNAGLQRDSPLLDMTTEQRNRAIAVNLTGQFLCARESRERR
jgi:NAD(P)-dependent dehydrogenase (short-subunit alcohol dehydrogenase family)